MPGFDGTGPYGNGAVGFGRGSCGKGARASFMGRALGRGAGAGAGFRGRGYFMNQRQDFTKEEELNLLKEERDELNRKIRQLEGD